MTFIQYLPCMCEFIYYKNDGDHTTVDNECVKYLQGKVLRFDYCPWCGSHIKDKNPIQVLAEQLGVTCDQMVEIFHKFGETDKVIPYEVFLTYVNNSTMFVKVARLREKLSEVKELVKQMKAEK